MKLPILKVLRNSMSLTLKELSNKLKYSISYIHSLENETRVFTVKHLNKYCEYFKISYTEFFMLNSIMLEERLPTKKEKAYLSKFALVYLNIYLRSKELV